MSVLLLRWLNDELNLYQNVEVLEKDASNGYLIAEVLHCHSLEPQLKNYSSSFSTAAKIHNMELLGEKFKALSYPFPVTTRRAIMMEDRLVVLDFFMQLKEFLFQRSNSGLTKVQGKKDKQSLRTTQGAVKPTFSPRKENEHLSEEVARKNYSDGLRFHKGHARYKQPRRLFLASERAALRLELDLKARRQLYAKKKLIESENDASLGLVDFERNMDRLGLFTDGEEQTLRAIPMNDAGAIAHLRDLENRVEDLDFRPSNNVQMMKELRKRRQAQLAEEKDRRFWRIHAKSAESIEVEEPGEFLSEKIVDQGNADLVPEAEISETMQRVMDPRERYLEFKREELEDHYARLREAGSAKREKDMKVLDELCAAKRKKKQLGAWNVCSDALDGLISLAIDGVLPSDRETLDVELMRKKQVSYQTSPLSPSFDQDSLEVRYELDVSIQNFLSCSEVWATLPLQSKFSTYDICSELQATTKVLANPISALNTTWHCPPSFILLSVYTEDDSGLELARRVSVEHHLALLQFDLLVEECVKVSYDPLKPGDQVASYTDRERELGVFGPKIAVFRQKNKPLSDALAVEILTKAVTLCQRQAVLPSSDGAPNIQPNGCMLHNFPRTLDEAKLLEKTLLANVSKGEGDAIKTANSETDEAAAPAIVSAWDCVISIPRDQVSVITDEVEADLSVQISDSSPGLVDKPTLSSTSVLSAESQRKLALDEEQRIRTDEHKANLEAYWSQTTRHIEIQRDGLQYDVVTEMMHLCIDMYTQASSKTIAEKIECKIDCLPEKLHKKRLERRESMTLVDRILWSKASNEIKLEDHALHNLLEMLHKAKESLHQKIRESIATSRSALHDLSTKAGTPYQALEKKLFSNSDPFQNLLDQASVDLKAANGPFKQKLRERILTKLEVSLGDMADIDRKCGNDFVHAFAQDSFSEISRAVDSVYQLLPSMCYLLKDFVLHKLEILRTQLYNRIPFLSMSENGSCSSVVSFKELLQEAKDTAHHLGGNDESTEVEQMAEQKVLTLLAQVASECSFNFNDETLASQYTLHESNVVSQVVARLLQQITLLCLFASQVKETCRHLYSVDIQRLQQCVEKDIHRKNRAIEKAMTNMALHGHATWAIRGLELSVSSGIANCLPHAYKKSFLTIAQLRALVSAFSTWEATNMTTSQAFGGPTIANDVFIALILDVAVKEAFPKRWRDPNAVTAITLQQSTDSRAMSWRKVIWSVLCIQFIDLPSIKDILAYHQRALNRSEVMNQNQGDATLKEPRNIFVSREAFTHLPLWFEDSNDKQDAERLKELMFHLFASVSNTDDSDTKDQVALVPMLLCWCMYPSCSFSIRRELERFTPRYSRGLLRVFYLLQQLSPTSSLSAISAAFRSPLSLSSFASFYHDCPSDWNRVYLLQNPFEALVQL